MKNNSLLKYRKIVDSAGNRILVSAVENSDEKNAVYFDLEKYNADNNTSYSMRDFTYDNDNNITVSPRLLAINAHEKAKKEILSLKAFLSRTDYINMTFLNGKLSDEDYRETKEMRDAAVDKINALEKQYCLYQPFDIPFFDNDTFIKRDNEKNYKFDIVIQCIARQEEPYFKEWVEHHLKIGFEHIYIYDNNDDCNTLPKYLAEHLAPEDFQKLTIIPWNTPMPYQQFAATYHYARLYSKETRWMLNIDLDEFFVTEKPLKLLLKEFEYASQVHFSWKNYGASGQLKYSDKPLRGRFVTTFEDDNLSLGKVMVRPRLITEYLIHNCILPEGAITVNTAHKVIKKPQIRKEESFEHATAYIEHYFTKSLEEWEQKIKRGCADGNWGRRYDLFFELNPDLLSFKNPKFQPVQNHTIPSAQTAK